MHWTCMRLFASFQCYEDVCIFSAKWNESLCGGVLPFTYMYPLHLHFFLYRLCCSTSYRLIGIQKCPLPIRFVCRLCPVLGRLPCGTNLPCRSLCGHMCMQIMASLCCLISLAVLSSTGADTRTFNGAKCGARNQYRPCYCCTASSESTVPRHHLHGRSGDAACVLAIASFMCIDGSESAIDEPARKPHPRAVGQMSTQDLPTPAPGRTVLTSPPFFPPLGKFRPIPHSIAGNSPSGLGRMNAPNLQSGGSMASGFAHLFQIPNHSTSGATLSQSTPVQSGSTCVPSSSVPTGPVIQHGGGMVSTPATDPVLSQLMPNVNVVPSLAPSASPALQIQHGGLSASSPMRDLSRRPCFKLETAVRMYHLQVLQPMQLPVPMQVHPPILPHLPDKQCAASIRSYCSAAKHPRECHPVLAYR